MVAAVAATMASASMADISIKGDAYIQYADNGTGITGSDTNNFKRVNLTVTGKYGATQVVVGMRADDTTDGTRVDNMGVHQFLYY